MSLKIFIDTGLANEGTGTVIDNGQSDKIEASYNNGRVSITVLQEQGMGARDYRMTPKARYTVNALKNISMYYDSLMCRPCFSSTPGRTAWQNRKDYSTITGMKT